MSDRTYAQVIVYACPEDQRAAALAAIFEAFGGEHINERPMIDTTPGAEGPASYAPSRWVEADALVLGEKYGTDECPLDMNETIAAAIIEAAPGAAFAAWVDPKYEYSGMLTMYAPELGRFDGPCDADGNATITGYAVRDMLARPEGTADTLRDRLRDALGLPWSEAFAIDADPRCDICGQRDYDPATAGEYERGDWNGDTGNHRSCEALGAARATT